MKYQLNGFYNEDCMVAMKEFPDKYFDLAIVDPPYGGGQAQELEGDSQDTTKWLTKPRSRFGGCFDKYEIKATKPDSKIQHWDIAPPQEYFDELFRISKNQIIWGGNYFDLPPTRCFLVWRKLTISDKFSMAMVEYAWTSFNQNAKCFEAAPQGNANEPRFHPTQKPVALYSWILNNYAKQGDKILDTHVGSASSLIACHKAAFDYIGFELDESYYKKAVRRIEAEKRQISFFEKVGI